MSILEVTRQQNASSTMFDLEFFKIVKKILRWTESPGSHYANDHERHLMKTMPLRSVEHEENAKFMPPRIIILHLYVRATYPAYFGLEINVSNAYLQEHHRAR